MLLFLHNGTQLDRGQPSAGNRSPYGRMIDPVVKLFQAQGTPVGLFGDKNFLIPSVPERRLNSYEQGAYVPAPIRFSKGGKI